VFVYWWQNLLIYARFVHNQEKSCPEITIDRYDLALLDACSATATPPTPLGEKASLSASQISRRIQRLEEAGRHRRLRRPARPAALGLGVTAFAQVILERHDKHPPTPSSARWRRCRK
jgi:DNA-binding Lrp family transcriptional regulator